MSAKPNVEGGMQLIEPSAGISSENPSTSSILPRASFYHAPMNISSDIDHGYEESISLIQARFTEVVSLIRGRSFMAGYLDPQIVHIATA